MDRYTDYEHMPYTEEEWDKAHVKSNYTFAEGGEWFADEWKFPNGVFYCEDHGMQLWYKEINGKLLQHNINGPSEYYYKLGNIRRIAWYYEGVEYSESDYDKIMKFLEKRKRRLARWVYEQWYTHFMRNPRSERGKKYIQKDYDRMITELDKLSTS